MLLAARRLRCRARDSE